MRFRILVLIFILTICANPIASKERIVKEKIQSGGRERTYYLFVPETLNSSRPAPLLVTLHGSGRDGRSLVELWRKLAAKNGIVVVGPDALNRQIWMTPHDGPDFLHELVESIKGRFDIDPERVYLFGHSAGAIFALMNALFEPAYFAAAAVHAGALPDPRQFIPFLPASRRIPIAIWVGDQDAFAPVTVVNATVEFLKANDFQVRLEVIKGHNHNYYGRADKINAAAWPFLESHSLDNDPEWVDHGFGSR